MNLEEYFKGLFEEDKEEFFKHIATLRKMIEDGEEVQSAILDEYDRYTSNPYYTPILKFLLYGWIHRFKYTPDPMRPFPGLKNAVEDEGGKKVVNYHNITTYLQKRYCVVTHARIMYVYENGRFIENKGIIEREIERILLASGIADKKKIREVQYEVLARLQWRTTFPEYPFNSSNEFIPLKNGVFWRKERILLPHSPLFGFTYCLPVKYNPNAECPKIDKFLSSLVSKENLPILYEIPASCLLRSPNFHHAYMLVGSGSNGKSTYLSLIQKFLGEENVSNVSLQELCEDRFKAAELIGKLANIHADIPRNPLRYTGKFKMLTGGDRITVEKKYKDPFSFINLARLIFSANQLPEVTDQSYAFWRRWIIVEFPNKFPQNPELFKELITEEELSGFLNKVLQHLEKIEMKGRVTVTKSVEAMMEEWMRRANSVYAFVKDCIEQDAKSYETKDAVYNAYVEYCEANDLRALSKNVFSQELQKHVRVQSGRVRVGGERVYVWYGIKLKKREEDEKNEKNVVDIDLTNIESAFDLTSRDA